MLRPLVNSSNPLLLCLLLENLLLRAAIWLQSSSSSAATCRTGLIMPLMGAGAFWFAPLGTCSIVEVPVEWASALLTTGRYRAESPMLERSDGAMDGV